VKLVKHLAVTFLIVAVAVAVIFRVAAVKKLVIPVAAA
jgi:hypothetical protein